MSATFVITAALMTYDIRKKYCHAVGQVTATQEKLRFTCQDLRAYFKGDKTLILRRIEARQHVRMNYKNTKNNITITGPRVHFENRQVVFTGGPHVIITTRSVILDKGDKGALDRGPIYCNATGSSYSNLKHRRSNIVNGSSIAERLPRQAAESSLAEDDGRP